MSDYDALIAQLRDADAVTFGKILLDYKEPPGCDGCPPTWSPASTPNTG